MSTPLLDYYYPTSVLITARDIITLWVVRMVLPAHQRDWSTADLQAASQACVSNVDFAELLVCHWRLVRQCSIRSPCTGSQAASGTPA